MWYDNYPPQTKICECDLATKGQHTVFNNEQNTYFKVPVSFKIPNTD